MSFGRTEDEFGLMSSFLNPDNDWIDDMARACGEVDETMVVEMLEPMSMVIWKDGRMDQTWLERLSIVDTLDSRTLTFIRKLSNHVVCLLQHGRSYEWMALETGQ